MSDGGRGSGNELGHDKKCGNDEYARAIARVAVGQVCESVGFHGFQQSALDTLSDIACRYVKDIGKTANLYANLAGRTEGNVLDTTQGLEDLGLAQGFSGASDVNRSLSSSGVVREVSQYVSVAEEIAFAYSIPRFPVIKEREPRQSFTQAGVSPPSEHIPSWLPRFPDPQTYSGLPSSSVKEADIMAGKVKQHHREVEPSGVSLQQQLASNGDAASNPFLAPPLKFGEKEVASVGCPPKLSGEGGEQNLGVDANATNPVFTLETNPGCSTLEAFGPAIEVMKNGMLDSEEGSRKFLRKSRPAVQLKFGVGMKFMDTSFRNPEKGTKEVTSWFGMKK